MSDVGRESPTAFDPNKTASENGYNDLTTLLLTFNSTKIALLLNPYFTT